METILTGTGNSKTYITPNEENINYWGIDKMEQIERQVIPETNLRELAATLSSKIEHKTVQEFLSDCDKIYDWLVQDNKGKRPKSGS